MQSNRNDIIISSLDEAKKEMKVNKNKKDKTKNLTKFYDNNAHILHEKLSKITNSVALFHQIQNEENAILLKFITMLTRIFFTFYTPYYLASMISD